MSFSECEIDCAIDVEVKAGGGFHVWVLNLDAGGKRTEKNTIKVKYAALPEVRYVAAIAQPENAPSRQPRRNVKRVEQDK